LDGMGAGAAVLLAQPVADANSEELRGFLEGLPAQERQRLTAAIHDGRKVKRSKVVALLKSVLAVKASITEDEVNILVQALLGEVE
jgi:hypothetical protein